MRSTITNLRDLMPLRRLTAPEALRVAERQANRLLSLCGVTEAPVSEAVIAAMPHIQIERVEVREGAIAATQWSHGRWVILLNRTISRARQRWSLAHELKHILDHPFVGIVYPRNGDRAEALEQACDYFAGCLLVPRRWLKAAWQTGIREPDELGRHFGVPPRAIKIRLLQVGLITPTSHYLAKDV